MGNKKSDKSTSSLYPHQQSVVDLAPKKWLFSWSCGVGKSATVLRLADRFNLPTLIVCPKSIVDNWNNEITLWSNYPENYTVISKETFRDKPVDPKNILILDEFHFWSNYKSKMFKKAKKYIEDNNIEYLYGLTATPYLSTPWNVYSYGLLFGKNWPWYKWKNHFFHDVKMGNRRIPIPKKGMEQQLITIIQKMGNTVDLKDCVDVPEHIYQKEYFELTQSQNGAINGLIDPTFIARYSKIFQIANGTLKSDGYTEDMEYKCEKFDRVIEIIAQHKKVAIIFRHNLEIERVAKTLKRDYIVLNGASKNRQELIDKFNNSDACVALVQASISEGYNMYTPVMVFYSLDYSLKNYVQMKGRAVRLNHLKSVVYKYLIVKNTIDSDVYENVVVKKMDFVLKLYNKKQ